jgi:hypothetical protein
MSVQHGRKDIDSGAGFSAEGEGPTPDIPQLGDYTTLMGGQRLRY